MSKKPAAGSDFRAKLVNTQQTEAYRELLYTEQRILKKQNEKDLKKKAPLFEENLNYLALNKKPEYKNMTNTIHNTEKQEQSKEDFYRSLPFHGDTENKFDPKNKKDRTWTL
eukprot:CAMPEP_0114589618 /NCGR_PEP_ID=MMETSP0125-20121206/12029_1 /TAXON_ID=485358 ORGANISM="Aristerostoma sp., Strain ATCC 50986" /NCGR_SAMPLE_ID=MMETSP0125 /ASSEMBLY_ACC=CAM_ASM_000245 /LENGTH=111 /DNA_ID=CAMNT_0001786611 /DNA_START=48 /DNA_END=383 /DNA_ORIENTATION=-